ncbi:MAG: hypothetical protein AAGF93_08935 [Cyanobacteria bacterium P01_H01_bin.105]
MQNPITYYAQTPAIDSLCELYGSHWQHMPHLEKLAIASATAQAVFSAESDVYDALLSETSIPYLAACDGFIFNNHNPVIELLEQLDQELDAGKATALVIGIYSNLDFTQSK